MSWCVSAKWIRLDPLTTTGSTYQSVLEKCRYDSKLYLPFHHKLNVSEQRALTLMSDGGTGLKSAKELAQCGSYASIANCTEDL